MRTDGKQRGTLERGCWQTALACSLVISAIATAQPAKSDPASSSVLKLPDGAVVVFRKTPENPTLPAEGVLLSAKDYQALVENSAQLQWLKQGGGKPIPPTQCKIIVDIQQRGSRQVAVLKVLIDARTWQPNTLVSLGGAKAQASAVKSKADGMPWLVSREDGLCYLAEKPGTHQLSLDLETSISPRGPVGELGFEVSLPKAAVTTLEVRSVPGIPRGNLTIKTADRPGENQNQPLDFPISEFPLGAAELLSLSWLPPAAVSKPQLVPPTAEVEARVRIDDQLIEVLGQIRLKGSANEWMIQTAPGMELSLTNSSGPTPPGATLTRPSDPAKAVWLFRSGTASEAMLTFTSRISRPRSNEPKVIGPYSIGPVLVLNATRQTNTLKLYAPRTLGLRPIKLLPEWRPQDLPAEDDLRLMYRSSSSSSGLPRTSSPPWLDLEVKLLPTSQRVQPTYTWTRFDNGSTPGWRVQTNLRVTPPLGGEISEFVIDVPASWEGEEFGPLDLLSGTAEGAASPGFKQRNLQLQTPQKQPIDLTLRAFVPAPLSSGSVRLPLPRFPKSTQADAVVSVLQPDGLQLRATGQEAGPLMNTATLQPPSGRGNSNRTLQASFEKGLTQLDLSWQPYRADLTVEAVADVSLQARQIVVEQALKLRSAEGEARPVRLRGPENATGWTFSCPAENLGNGEWLIRPAADPRDWSFSLSFALPMPTPRADLKQQSVPLAWIELATRTDTLLRVWGGGTTRRLNGYSGSWRQLPPEILPDRTSLPWLTLSGNGTRLPLLLHLEEDPESTASQLVERCLVQASLNDDGSVMLRTRFLLKRWHPGGLEVEVPTSGLADFFLESKRVDPTPISELSPTARLVRLPVPAVSNRRNVLPVEIVQNFPPQPGDREPFLLSPPRLRSAMYRSAPRWLILVPSSTLPLLWDGNFFPEVRWSWDHGWPSPQSRTTTQELDQWLSGSIEADRPNQALIGLQGRQAELAPLSMLLVPRLAWYTVATLLSLLVTILLWRASRSLVRWLLVLLAVAGTALLIVAPLIASWLFIGLLPGIVLGWAVVGVEQFFYWLYERRRSHLPGFRRTTPLEETAAFTPAASSRTAPPREGSGSQPVSRAGVG